MFTRYSVIVGDALWTALYGHVEENYNGYTIESVCEDGETKFAVLTSDNKYYRLNFSEVEGAYEFATETSELESYTPGEEPQFSQEDVENFVKSKDEEGKEDQNKTDENTEEEKCPKCHKPLDECECKDDEEEPKKYALEEIPEYVELQTNYSNLEAQYNTLKAEKEELEAKIAPLAEFKANAEKKEKQDMIDSFYMLSDEDKKDVIDNIDTYSVDDIEAKLSVICVRNKVSFSLEDDEEKIENPTTYNLNDVGDDNATTPAWVKAALEVAKNMN